MSKIIVLKNKKTIGQISFDNETDLIINIPASHKVLYGELNAAQPMGEDTDELATVGTLENTILALNNLYLDGEYDYKLDIDGDGKADNSLGDKAENGPGYNPNRDPETGEFTFGSGSGSSRSPAQAQKLSEIENSIRSRKKERFYAIDDSGEIIAELDGNENTVKIDFMTAAKIAGGKNVVLTHNHPSQGHRGGQKLTYPFSKHDLQAAAMMNPKTIRAVGDTHEYELTRKEKWGAPSELKRTQTLALKKVDTKLWEKVNAREMTREMASFERHHLALQEVAKKFDLIYERTERSE